MKKRAELSAEMAAMRSSLAESPPAARAAEPAAARSATAAEDELTRALGELRECLGTLPSAAEEEIAAHPLASVAAAFLLGVAVGRLSRGI